MLPGPPELPPALALSWWESEDGPPVIGTLWIFSWTIDVASRRWWWCDETGWTRKIATMRSPLEKRNNVWVVWTKVGYQMCLPAIVCWFVGWLMIFWVENVYGIASAFYWMTVVIYFLCWNSFHILFFKHETSSNYFSICRQRDGNINFRIKSKRNGNNNLFRFLIWTIIVFL